MSEDHEAGQGQGRGAEEGRQGRKKAMEMPTFGSAMRFRVMLNHIGDIKLAREVSLNQAIWAVLAAIIVFFISGLFMAGIYRAAPVIATLWLTPGLVAPLEESGRSVPRTIWRLIAFYMNPRLYFGVVPLRSTPIKKRRIEAMIAGQGAGGAKNVPAVQEILSTLADIGRDLWAAYTGAMKRGGSKRRGSKRGGSKR